jgi:isochorismate synthase
LFDLKQNITAVHLSQLLLKKGISFCLYRLPESRNYNLAIQRDFLLKAGQDLTSGEEADFIIAPFIKNSESKAVLLRKFSLDQNNAAFISFINSIDDRPTSWSQLPSSATKEDYLQKIGNYLADIKSGKLLKAILSRVILIDKSKDFDPFNFFVRLESAYPETFASLFYVPEMGIWAGATPELLLKKEKNQYYSMALAATQPKNNEGNYVWRKKEEEEHRLVRLHIEDVFLKNDCVLIDSKGPYTIETGQVAHLKTDYTFEEKGVSDLAKIIAELHPTPAVGGLPVNAALNCINQYEGYNRNYYTGYIGEINGSDSAQLFINLRCMQIEKDKIAIFVGGGISQDSEPGEEWTETEQKSLTLLEIIDKTNRAHTN